MADADVKGRDKKIVIIAGPNGAGKTTLRANSCRVRLAA